MATPVEPKPNNETKVMHSRTGGQGAIDLSQVSAEAPAPDIVERLRSHKADIWNWNGEAMTAWDGWRKAIANGDKGSWPRDAFENLIGSYGEDMDEAADTITRLTAEVERLVKSRNRWGQKYNKLLSAVRTENAYGVYAEARDTYREKITELAAENEKLRNDLRLAIMSDSKECAAISEVNASLTAEVERLTAEMDIRVAAAERMIARRDADNERLRAALLKITDALNQGRIAPSGHGVSGMTIDAQMRASVYNGVPVWPIEEAREILDEINARAALKEPRT